MPHAAQSAPMLPISRMRVAKKLKMFWKRVNWPDHKAAYRRMKTSHAVPIRIVTLARHRIPRNGRRPHVHGGPCGGPPHGGCGGSGGDPGCMVNLSPANACGADKDSGL